MYTYKYINFTILLLSTVALHAQSPQTMADAQDLIYKITYIVDGDTFDGVDTVGNKIRFRPIGLDTPETGKRNGRPELYHQEATDWTADLLKDKNVRVVYDVQSKDRWGRHLVYVYLLDGTFYNEAIIRAGWAVVATYPPNVNHVKTFLAAQKEAREQGKGVWEAEVGSKR